MNSIPRQPATLTESSLAVSCAVIRAKSLLDSTVTLGGACCVIAHLWVHESQRGRGLGRMLMQAAEEEARQRGCEQVVLSTHTLQAPKFYERLGYERQVAVLGQPKGHANVIYVKRLDAS